jgi:hypothetical protein
VGVRSRGKKTGTAPHTANAHGTVSTPKTVTTPVPVSHKPPKQERRKAVRQPLAKVARLPAVWRLRHRRAAGTLAGRAGRGMGLLARRRVGIVPGPRKVSPFQVFPPVRTQWRAQEGPEQRIGRGSFFSRPGSPSQDGSVTPRQPRTSFFGGKGGSGDGENINGILG